MPDPTLLRLRFSSDPELLAVVRCMLERLADILGFTASEGRAVTIAVDEALTNIIRHAYHEQRGKPIEISLRRLRRRVQQGFETGLEIRLTDRGPAIDRSRLHGRHLDDIKPGGLGLHFIRQCMDVVNYRRVGGTNQLRLIKYSTKQESSQA